MQTEPLHFILVFRGLDGMTWSGEYVYRYSIQAGPNRCDTNGTLILYDKRFLDHQEGDVFQCVIKSTDIVVESDGSIQGSLNIRAGDVLTRMPHGG